jgi:hypothetical protein
MALLHDATLRPTKLELLAAWLPDRPWSRIPAGATIERVAACRFDDPAGEVGIETILVRSGDGPIHHTPLTYRGAPLDGADAWLIGTMEHSVLGLRYAYDASADPVYAAALATAILTGAGEAEEFIEVDGQPRRREPHMTVRGSGTAGTPGPTVNTVRRVVNHDPTRVETDSLELAVVRVLDGDTPPTGPTLTGTWPGLAAPVPLAYVVSANR